MGDAWFHVAQVNVARARVPLDDPLLADFRARIDEVNAAAERSPGFVWRYTDDEESPAAGDSRFLFNLSVWEDPDALRRYVQGAAHRNVMRRRGEWFEQGRSPSLALWWLPAGDRPGASEAMERLAFLAQRGPSDAAFTFRESFLAPPAPESEGRASAVCYDGRRFATVENSRNGDVGSSTIFEYRQRGGRVWAKYGGPGVLFGSLVAASDEGGALDMRYRHFTPSGELRAGVCRSTPEILSDGRLRMHEDWRWTVGDRSPGHSVIEEVR